jgi:hypothetical protein
MYINQDTRIQILDSISELPGAEKDQCGAFIVRIYIFDLFPHLYVYYYYYPRSATKVPWFYGATSSKPSRRYAKT